MSDIKIFMCCHKPYETVPPMCIPIQCGSALNQPVEGAAADDIGENISAKNREYCELTAHYCVWKNVTADYYGFCHYRRFFCADETVGPPYTVRGTLSEKEYGKLLLNEEQWQRLVRKYDIIVPRSEDMGLSTREHYCTSRFHYTEDLELFAEILREKSPQLIGAMDKYLSQNRQYFCNMFVMSGKYFFEYCEILFAVLQEFDKRKTVHGDFQSDRTDGYLGEIFTGIYVGYCSENGARIKELPRLDTECPVKKRLLYKLLPPESKRRFLVKRLVKRKG
ncbi:MAG: DUF4422 domain-containing protein [Oscillospiraceae bacterium]|nr:DUF4422 domain-containing protein [Oscillospiraceae bacterium]